MKFETNTDKFGEVANLDLPSNSLSSTVNSQTSCYSQNGARSSIMSDDRGDDKKKELANLSEYGLGKVYHASESATMHGQLYPTKCNFQANDGAWSSLGLTNRHQVS